MPVCAKLVTTDAGQVLALDTAATDFTKCSYVVLSGSDVSNSFLQMSAEDGALFSGGLVSVWFAAWGMRQVISIIRGSSSNE